MTRETKLSILIGVSLVLVVAILISDHFSTANNAELAAELDPLDPGAETTGVAYEMEAPPVIVQDETGRFVPFESIAANNEPIEAERSTLSELAQSLQDEFEMFRENGVPAAAQTDTTENPRAALPPRNLLEDAEPEPKPTTTAPEQTHTVREGDTLWSIAQRYYGNGALHADLTKFNGLPAGSALEVGQKLRIPARSGLGQPAPKPAASPGPKGGDGYKVYTVQAGDTLSQIAQRECGSVSKMYDIRDAQGRSIGEPDDFVLRVGMTLRLPN